MLLCKYFGEFGIDVIRNLRLKLSHPQEFNDPFECLMGIKKYIPTINQYKKRMRSEEFSVSCKETRGLTKQQVSDIWSDENISKRYDECVKHLKKDSTQKEIDKSRKTIRDDLFQDKRLLCFASTEMSIYDDILMWAHYADSHRGVKIVFDTDLMSIISKNIEKVIYRKKQSIYDYKLYYLAKNEKMKKSLKNMWRTKSSLWKHEREWRWLLHIGECIFEDKHYFKEISPRSIKEIYFGCDINLKDKQAYCDLLEGEELCHVKIYETQIGKFSYDLRYEKIR